ncbi:RNA pyrophosphohydrolase [Tropicimonas sp. S265A]|uniref:RNA pyrophosphohydrolase n=1 Tax=Tropicimonas sp. S265A TaxID=3415134 RepID=UPI003C7B61F7
MTPEDIARLPYRPCVGVVLMDKRGRVFAGQRIDSDVPAWQMPQGGIDADETPRDAALRELTEETGVEPDQVAVVAETADWITYDLPHDIVPRIWKGRFKGQKQKWVLLRFLGNDADIDIETEIPEFNQWRWLEPAVVLEAIVPFKREVYAAVFAEFADILAVAD